MKRFLICAVLTALVACSPAEEAGQPAADLSVVRAAHASCRPTAAGRQVTGCYLALTASRDDILLSVESEASALGQVHESRMESNMMMMGELKEGLPLPAGQTVLLEPGGDHIMLMGVKAPLVAGDTVPLTLIFANAEPVEIIAAVGQPAPPATASSGGMH